MENEKASPVVENRGTPRKPVLTLLTPGKLADILLHWEDEVKFGSQVEPFIARQMDQITMEERERARIERESYERIFEGRRDK